jgi:hypothetical protein
MRVRPIATKVGGKAKFALYRETLQTTGFYVGRVVIVLREFATIPSRRGQILKLQNAFSRHDGIYPSDAGICPQPGKERRLPPAAPHPSLRTRQEERVLLIVQMSSGRLFLDRVGRHQSPSPLHRHPQISMHFSQATAKGDVSTLPGGGHFYFALTGPKGALTTGPSTRKILAVCM